MRSGGLLRDYKPSFEALISSDLNVISRPHLGGVPHTSRGRHQLLVLLVHRLVRGLQLRLGAADAELRNLAEKYLDTI